MTDLQAILDKGGPWERAKLIGGQLLIQGDCREVMAVLPKVDACVTDPPYGVGYAGSVTKHGKNGSAYASFEDTPEMIRSICVPAIRTAMSLARSGIMTPGRACAMLYDPPRAFGAIFYPSGANTGPWGFVCSQPLFYYGKDPYLMRGLGRRPDGFSTTEATDRSVKHPCPKPLGTMQWMVARVSFETETILDPFMGSGTTLVACQRLGRQGIGIELDPDYWEIACKRVQEVVDSPPLFTPEPPKAVQEAMDL